MNSKRKKIATGIALALGIGLIAGVATVSAVHSINLFELGPGLSTDEGGLTNILGDGNTANGPDWADIFDANGNVVKLFGGNAAAFVKDDVSAGSAVDSTAYPKGGSDKNSDTVGSWTWTSASVPAKDDITNAYSYAVTNPANGHLIIYSGVEREDPSGDSHVDLEFFQKPISLSENPPCSMKKPCTFNGSNTDGDLLVNMDFSTGGSFAGLTIRERHEGVQNNYDLIATLGGQGCNAGDTVCAFANGGNIDGGPWPNFDNHGSVITTLQANSFTEFGVDVTAVLGFTPCFSTVEVKTRSSGSFTAELKDFALHGFQQCSASVVTQVHNGPTVGPNHTSPDIQQSTVAFGTTVHDKAIVTGTTGFPTPTGSVTFKFFTTGDCTGSSTDQVATLVETNAPTSTTPGTAAQESSTSSPLTPGSYSYQAVYSGDTNYPSLATSSCEPLTVSRHSSAVNTDIRKDNINGSSVLNTAVDASGAGTIVVDVAAITGNTSGGPDPTGTVTFRRFTAANCTGGFADETVTIIADSNPSDGLATAVSSTQTLNTPAGSFLSFQVIYNGDSNYDPSAASICEPLCAFPFVR